MKTWSKAMSFVFSRFFRKFSPGRGTHRPSLSVTAAIFVSAAIISPFALSGDASAVPAYTLNHNPDAAGNTRPIDVIGPQSEPIEFSFDDSTDFLDFADRNRGFVRARADQGSLGIKAIASNNGQFLPQRQEVSVVFEFDTIFASSGTDPISVIMNMTLSGIVTPGNNNTHVVQVFAGTSLNRFGGSYSELLGGPTIQDGMLATFSDDGTDQTIATNPFLVSVNEPVRMFMQLVTSQAYGTDPGSIDFGSTMSLPSAGDVFTIVGGEEITVTSEDAGIIDNRFGVSAQVPEPGTLALLGIGVAGLGVMRRRRKAA